MRITAAISLSEALHWKNKDHRPVSIVDVAASFNLKKPFWLSTLVKFLEPAVVLTHHNDNARTGWNPNEDILTVDNVMQATFGELFSQQVDGDVYAQPLYVPSLHILVDGVDKGIHNVVFVATENNSVYAFDADSDLGHQWLWRTNVCTNHLGECAVPYEDMFRQDGESAEGIDVNQPCPNVKPKIGITSTPVIDVPSSIMYVVAKIKNTINSTYMNRLVGIEITGGTIVREVNINGTFPSGQSNTDIVFDSSESK